MADELEHTKVPGGAAIDGRWHLVTDARPPAAGGHEARVYEWTGDGPKQHRVLSDGAGIDLVVSCDVTADQFEFADWMADLIADGTLCRAGMSRDPA